MNISDRISISPGYGAEEKPDGSLILCNNFVDSLPEKYNCGTCKSQPHVTECCGQHFCKDCLKKSASQNTEQQQHNSF